MDEREQRAALRAGFVVSALSLIVVTVILVVLLIANFYRGRQLRAEAPVSRAAVESYATAWCRDNVPVELLASADEAAATCRRNLMNRYDVAKELEKSAREMKK